MVVNKEIILLKCFQYSNVWYSDPHCTLIFCAWFQCMYVCILWMSNLNEKQREYKKWVTRIQIEMNKNLSFFRGAACLRFLFKPLWPGNGSISLTCISFSSIDCLLLRSQGDNTCLVRWARLGLDWKGVNFSSTFN